MDLELRGWRERYGPWSAGRTSVSAYTNAQIRTTFDGGRVHDQYDEFAIVWSRAPRGARIAQTVAFRASGVRRDGSRAPFGPDTPHTDITVRDPRVRFPLSEPEGGYRWSLDALHPEVGEGVDVERAYATDADYGTSDRNEDGDLLWTDGPNVWCERSAGWLARHHPSLRADLRISSIELSGTFHTYLLAGSSLSGVVEWRMIFSQTVDRAFDEDPLYRGASFSVEPPAYGLSLDALRTRIRTWQAEERGRPRAERRAQP
jgi:hypothetical protein